MGRQEPIQVTWFQVGDLVHHDESNSRLHVLALEPEKKSSPNLLEQFTNSAGVGPAVSVHLFVNLYVIGYYTLIHIIT